MTVRGGTSGGNRVAFLYDEDVAGDDLRCWNLLLLSVADDPGARGRHLVERCGGRLGAGFLDVAHHRVQHHDGKDGDGLVGQRRLVLHVPKDNRDGSRRQQQHDEKVRNCARNLFQAAQEALRRAGWGRGAPAWRGPRWWRGRYEDRCQAIRAPGWPAAARAGRRRSEHPRSFSVLYRQGTGVVSDE